MSVAVHGDHATTYTCRCLNVSIHTATTDTAPPESVDDPAYKQVFVGEGIEIKHPQLTLRSRKRVSAVSGTNRYSRYTTLKCLVCNIPVYRVFQTIPSDVEGKDGPILPSEDYVEKEIMKSPNGWVEVSKDLWTGEAVTKAQTGASYSSLFDLIVPPIAPTEPKSTNNGHNIPRDSSRSRSPPPKQTTYFCNIKPVLPPPPFTPSHPAFLHMAQLAEQESHARRQAAENYVAEIVRQKTEEIERGDAATRQQVEALWRKFGESMKEVHLDSPFSPRTTLRRSSRSRERPGRSLSPSHVSRVAVKDFVPVPVPARMHTSPLQRPSALSASLVTSNFHHPRAAIREQSPPGQDSGSPASESTKTISTQSGSSTLVQPVASESVNILNFRRNIDDTINTQASYRYFRNMEEDIARVKQRREEQSKAAVSENPTEAAPNANGETPTTSRAAGNVPNTGNTEAPDTTPQRGRQAKGKRKVTFDVEPDVPKARRKSQGEQGTESADVFEDSRGTDMIFDIEDLEGDDKKAAQPPPSLPLLEQPTISRPTRLGRARPQVMPEALAGLRPASLPAPSHIRPLRSQPGVDSSSSSAIMFSLPQNSVLARRPPRANGTKSPTSPTKAGGPSDQRGSRNGEMRNRPTIPRGSTVASSIIPEESETETTDTNSENGGSKSNQPVTGASDDDDESEDDLAPLPNLNLVGGPGSLPIHILLKTQAREPLTLASYRPETAIPQEQQEASADTTVNGGHKVSSASIRNAVYAERDRLRSMDPGTQDFQVFESGDEDESDDEDPERARVEAYLSTTRGRRQALRILQARSELPDSGMWRSLAN
ncbi:hypothetical protein FA15DRAFT_667919 [Coprinopsis marcescibilis]|uniref:Uncharacterized protein n=1 Tax=Coprinopsis marcescibilis TaxID=230819 RepID=A0A5C3LC74_COPMA|nr:hypothetical protein FA15DRAFT_667919 [Coprinopsis marcescibilis]